MQISWTWLNEWIQLDESVEEVGKKLTMTGLEVETIEIFEKVKGGFSGVVIGKVLSCEQHPNADKLRLTTVDVGKETLQIVCGAPNVATGQFVAVALIGTTLYPTVGEPLTLKPAKIRGVESQGMICALDELGLGTDHSGIWVLNEDSKIDSNELIPGTPLAKVLKLESEPVYSIGITPNRTDALSHFGVARDLAAVLREQIDLPDLDFNPSIPNPVNLDIQHTGKCPLYTGLVIKGLQVKESPQWLKDKLCAIGERPINAVVDITNFVMFDLGQPLHAFDLKMVENHKIVVRTPFEEEKEFLCLDGKKRNLKAEDLLICDSEKAMCLAGVMGGLMSGVNESTTEIFLESAYFEPSSVRNTVKHTGIHSASAFRFERGTDPEMVEYALQKAALMIIEICGGECSEIVKVQSHDFEPVVVSFSFDKARKLIGKDISNEEMLEILDYLDIHPQLPHPLAPSPKGEGEELPEGDKGAEALNLQIPLYRHDVTRFQDVVEEIIRIYGLNNIEEGNEIRANVFGKTIETDFSIQAQVSDFLSAQGYREILNNSLISKDFSNEKSVKILNPLSEELAVMRQSMIWGGLESLAWNLNRQISDIQMYEFGKVYFLNENGKVKERKKLALWLCGNDFPQNWAYTPKNLGFFSLKSSIEKLISRFPLQTEETGLAEVSELSWGIAWKSNNQIVATLGLVKSELCKKADIKSSVYYAEIDWEWIVKSVQNHKITFKELPKFPTVRRDISLQLTAPVSFATFYQTIKSANPKLIRKIALFDLYINPKENLKSYAFSVYISDDNKTLTDETVDKLMERTFGLLEKLEGVSIRKS